MGALKLVQTATAADGTLTRIGTGAFADIGQSFSRMAAADFNVPTDNVAVPPASRPTQATRFDFN